MELQHLNIVTEKIYDGIIIMYLKDNWYTMYVRLCEIKTTRKVTNTANYQILDEKNFKKILNTQESGLKFIFLRLVCLL